MGWEKLPPSPPYAFPWHRAQPLATPFGEGYVLRAKGQARRQQGHTRALGQFCQGSQSQGIPNWGSWADFHLKVFNKVPEFFMHSMEAYKVNLNSGLNYKAKGCVANNANSAACNH